ncbi:MAG: thioredoxin family protein [Chloroflexi bacterium]|nr:thioredoxin family protein [Chloroflexota bacterium]
MRVELLYADGDPAAMVARQNLVEVLTEDAFETPIQMIAVASAEDAELLGMRGSPTIRIDGEDIDPEGSGAIGVAPRVYGDGGSVPDKDLIRRAVETARGWSHGRRS